MRTVPAWRIAWKAPLNASWRLGVYEFLDQADGQAYCDYLKQECGFKAALVETTTMVTEHGVNG